MELSKKTKFKCNAIVHWTNNSLKESRPNYPHYFAHNYARMPYWPTIFGSTIISKSCSIAATTKKTWWNMASISGAKEEQTTEVVRGWEGCEAKERERKETKYHCIENQASEWSLTEIVFRAWQIYWMGHKMCFFLFFRVAAKPIPKKKKNRNKKSSRSVSMCGRTRRKMFPFEKHSTIQCYFLYNSQ